MFSDHQPGEAYCLSREQFLQFAGLTVMAAAFSAAIQSDADRRGQEPHRLQERALWAAIASFEAAREFNPFMGGCHSDVAITSHGIMRWSYQTTSGTLFEVIEARECLRDGGLPEPSFLVTIPEDRDQPGRYHHDQLRNGGSYCE